VGDVQRITGAITVQTYDELRSYVRAFADGHLNLLIIVGSGGVGKSRNVRDALCKKEVCWIEGNASPLGMYMRMYKNPSDIVVIDDVDALYRERSGVRLLKSLCQTEDEKRIAWYTAAPPLRIEDVPNEFTTRCRVVIVSNDWETLNRNVEAVQDRGHLLVFAPTAREVHAHVTTWFEDGEILDWMDARLAAIGRPSIRHYLRAAELKRAGMDWTQAVVTDPAEHPRARVVRELALDPRYGSEQERIHEFKRRGHGCRATYFNWKRRLGLTGTAAL
jgi:hypothetical protein